MKRFLFLSLFFLVLVFFISSKKNQISNTENVIGKVMGASTPNWGAWNHGGELNQTVLSSTAIDGATGNLVRLGDPSYSCSGGVPLGSAWMKKVINPAQIKNLNFRYRIITNDRNIPLGDEFDSFDVLINSQRVFRDANTNPNATILCSVSPYDLGWENATINLSSYSSPIELKFVVNNRPDNYYNTYVYLDQIIDGTNACLFDNALPQCVASSCSTMEKGDLNCDGSINSLDLSKLLFNYKN